MAFAAGRPPRSATMDPTSSPPWRVLETPPLDQAPDRPTSRPSPDDRVPTRSATAVRIGGIAVATVAVAVLAIVLAGTTDGGAVRVDGGSILEVGSADASPPGPDGGDASGALVVEIVGAIADPGVYRLDRGARLVDLLRAAGGYSPRVDTARLEAELNLAAPLTDGAHIRIPSRDDPAGTAIPRGPTGGASGGPLVDLNRATQAELEALPGIGPATATKIITAREEARFASVDELRSRGILGEKTFLKLRDLLTVG
jgi:competence protein ComEA